MSALAQSLGFTRRRSGRAPRVVLALIATITCVLGMAPMVTAAPTPPLTLTMWEPFPKWNLTAAQVPGDDTELWLAPLVDSCPSQESPCLPTLIGNASFGIYSFTVTSKTAFEGGDTLTLVAPRPAGEILSGTVFPESRFNYLIVPGWGGGGAKTASSADGTIEYIYDDNAHLAGFANATWPAAGLDPDHPDHVGGSDNAVTLAYPTTMSDGVTPVPEVNTFTVLIRDVLKPPKGCYQGQNFQLSARGDHAVNALQQCYFDYPYPSQRSLSLSAATATAGSNVSVEAMVRDDWGNPIEDREIELFQQGATHATITLESKSNKTGGFDPVKFTVTDTVAEKVTLVARDRTGTDSDTWVSFPDAEVRPVITFLAGAPVVPSRHGGSDCADWSCVKVTPSTGGVTYRGHAAADGHASATVKVHIEDRFGNADTFHQISLKPDGTYDAQVVPVAPTTAGECVTTSEFACSDDEGWATFEVSDTTAEPVSYSVIDVTTGTVWPSNTNGDSALIDFLGPDASASTVCLPATEGAACPSSVGGVATTTVTATLKNAQNATLQGRAVRLVPSPAAEGLTISPETATTDASGQAQFVVANPTLSVGTQTVSFSAVALADTTNLTLEDTVSVVFAPRSGMTVEPATVFADGTRASTVKVTVKDSTGAVMANAPVGLTASGSALVNDAADSASANTDATGVATFRITDTTVESVTLTATLPTTAIPCTPTGASPGCAAAVDFIAPAASATATATPTSVPADGHTTSTITVIAKNASGGTVAGSSISLSQGSGHSTIKPAIATTSSDGTATFTVFNPTEEAVTYTVHEQLPGDRTKPLNEDVTVTFTALTNEATESTIAASPTTVPADGTSATAVTVTLKDGSGMLLFGHAVILSTGSGSTRVTGVAPSSDGTCSTEGSAVPVASTDGSGIACFVVRTGTVQDVTLHATDANTGTVLKESAQVSFTLPKTEANQSTVTASSLEAIAGGTGTTVTVTLRDGHGPIVGNTVTASTGSSTSSVTPATATSNASGQVSFTVSNSAREQVTIRATDTTTGVTLDQPVVVTFIGTEAELSTMTVGATSVPADGTSAATVAVILLDGYGDPITGHTVSLGTNPQSTSAVIAPVGSSQTDASGHVSFTISNSNVEALAVVATDDTAGVTINDQSTITFTKVRGGGKRGNK